MAKKKNFKNKTSSNKKTSIKRNREEVLDRLSKGNFSEDIINNEEENSNEGKRIGRSVINRPVSVEILDDDPSALVVLKQCIIESEITTEEIYEKVGRQVGYGLIYDIETKNRCTMKKFDLWMEKIFNYNVEYSISENKK